jgi:sigma-B regulation protein RsbU (phosphoserine phosphatase)
MKVLVAEDDPLSLRVLTKALEEAHHDVQFVTTGAAALDVLLSAEAPTIALLDWMMPELDGLEVCRQVRSSVLKVRPYLIIVSAKTEKTEIVAGLDAGADDFISKPIWFEELLARMRVAERTINYQLELQKQIDKFESLAQRYSLLGEIVAQQLQRPTEPDALDDLAALEARPPPVAPTRPEQVWFDPGEIEALVPRALTDLGLSANPVIALPGERAAGVASFMAWTCFVDTGQNRWIDLVLEIDAKAASVVYQRALRRAPASPKEIVGFLDETHTVIGTALKAALQAKGCRMIAPLLSRALQRDLWDPALRIPAESQQCRFDLDGVTLDLVTVCYTSTPQPRPAGELQPQEILAEPYPAAAIPGGQLFPAGTALNRHSIEKIVQHAGPRAAASPLSVFTLSPTAQYFARIAGNRL